MTAPNAAFVIRDGVLTVPSWEWSSDEGMLLGYRLENARVVNGNRSSGWRFSIPPHIEGDIFWEDAGDSSERATLYLSVDGLPRLWADRTADELLRLIADIASRPPHQQEEE